jgi:tRNA 2-selenouridine synthase
MPTPLDIEKFLEMSQEHPVIDVRTPAEFEKGHIPSAYNLPLMDNVERAIIGTIYKQAGKQPAILKGLEYAGPRLKEMVKAAKKIPNKGTLLVHCWRGGMRSGFYAWILEFYGFQVFTLRGGYKSFRTRILKQFSEEINLIVVGGKTGSGKTYVLEELKKQGEQIIDLEKIAHHKGSSFGGIGQAPPPSQEVFENILGMQLMKLDRKRKIWIEDESRTIGHKVIPINLWNQMRAAEMFFLDIPFEKRLLHIVGDYGKCERQELINATERIRKRLGDEQCNAAISALMDNNYEEAFSYSLKYYDKAYLHNVKSRDENRYKIVSAPEVDPVLIARELQLMSK